MVAFDRKIRRPNRHGNMEIHIDIRLEHIIAITVCDISIDSIVCDLKRLVIYNILEELRACNKRHVAK